MNWIEQIFHVSPDTGNGSLELLYIASPIAALLIGFVTLLWFRNRRKHR
jgi:LPXTG-motif cell wall-anchored protein